MNPLEPGPTQVGERPEAEGDRPVLGGRVESLARRRTESGERDDVDHVAVTDRPHPLERRQGPVDRPQRVDVEQRPARIGVVLPDQAGDQDSGVVDPDVQRAGPLDGGGGRGATSVGVADVEPRPERRRADRLGGRLGRRRLDVGDVDGQPPGGERPRHLEAEAASGAGDEGCGHGGSIELCP